MTKWEAVKEFEKIMGTWMDFDYWAYCQLEMRGEWSQERMVEVLENHQRAEERLSQYQDETFTCEQEMQAAGAPADEILAYSQSRQDEHKRLLNAWRSLEGLSECNGA